jgi:hypothetical protein
MDRIFDVQPDTFSGTIRRTLFSFESNGKRYLSVLVDGDLKLVSGQTITAILKNEDDWQTLLGMRIHETGDVFAPGTGLNVWLLLMAAFSAGIWYMKLSDNHPEAVALTLAGHVLIAAFFVRRAITAQRIRRALRPMTSPPQD